MRRFTKADGTKTSETEQVKVEWAMELVKMPAAALRRNPALVDKAIETVDAILENNRRAQAQA